MTYSYLVQGLRRSWQLKEILFFFVVLNLGIALIFTLPYVSLFIKFFSNRIATHSLAKQDLYTFYAEFVYYNAPLKNLVKYIVIAGYILHFLMILVFSGGLVHYYWIHGQIRWKIYFSQSFRYFLRLFFLIIILFILIALIINITIFIILPFKSLLPSPFVENVYFWFYLIYLILITTLVFLVSMIFDIARFLLVGYSSRSIMQPILKAIRFFMRFPVQITVLYIILTSLSFSVIFAYWILQKFIPDTENWGIVARFIVLQVFIFFHYWVRFSRYGTLIALYKSKA